MKVSRGLTFDKLNKEISHCSRLSSIDIQSIMVDIVQTWIYSTLNLYIVEWVSIENNILIDDEESIDQWLYEYQLLSCYDRDVLSCSFWYIKSVSTFKYHQTNDGTLSMSACYSVDVRSCVLFSFKKQTNEPCLSTAELHLQSHRTQSRIGHVCLMRIDVIHCDDDPISEQLTIITVDWIESCYICSWVQIEECTLSLNFSNVCLRSWYFFNILSNERTKTRVNLSSMIAIAQVNLFPDNDQLSWTFDKDVETQEKRRRRRRRIQDTIIFYIFSCLSGSR